MAKRRSNGEGAFRKRPNGKWEWQVMIGRDINGKPIRRSFYGNTKKDAADIGFRDDFIYEYLDNQEGNNYLDLKQIDRDKTIKSFNDFKNKKDKTIYWGKYDT